MTGMPQLTDRTPAHRVGREEFERLRDREDGLRYELLAGEVLVTPSPAPAHQLVVAALITLLSPLAPAGCLVLPAPLDVLLGESDAETVLQPDLVMVPREAVAASSIQGVPLLVVEVLSPSTWRRDLGVKRDTYAAAGVEHYWVVSPTVPSLTVYRLGPDRVYRELAHVTGADVVELTAPVRLRISPADLVS